MRNIFIKFNDARRKEFNIRTTIIKDNNKRVIVKQAEDVAGESHIKRIYKNQEILSKIYSPLQICPCTISDNKLYFDYIEGDLLFDKYLKAVQKRDKEEFLSLISFHLNLLIGKESNQCIFTGTTEFMEVFGEASDYEGKRGLKVTNFEATPYNIILVNGNINKPVFIDYEWVFEYPMPLDFVIYQCILSLYRNIPMLEKVVSISELMTYLKVDTKLEILENTFKNLYTYLSHYNGSQSTEEIKFRYIKNNIDIKEIINADPMMLTQQKQIKESLEWHRNRVKELEGAIEYHQANDRQLENEKKELEKQLEWQRNHSRELEGAIEYHQANDRQLENEKEELEKQLEWHRNREKELKGAIEYHQANDRQLENEKQELEKQLEWYKNRERELEGAIEYHHNYEEQLNQKINQQEIDYISLEEKIEQEKQTNMNLRRQIFEMENSLSWKITKFLRRR